MQQLRTASRLLANQRSELLIDRLRISTRQTGSSTAQFSDFFLSGHKQKRRCGDAVETHQLVVLHLRSVVKQPCVQGAEAVQVLHMKQRSYPYQTGLFELGNGHVLRQYEPQLFVLDHQSQVGVAVVDLRDELAVANLQKGKQRK